MKAITPRSRRRVEFSLLTPLLTTALVIAALYYGRYVLIPFALALLLSFLLTPPVSWLEKKKLPRAPAVVLVLVFAFSGLGLLLWLGVTQLADIAGMIPSYQDNIHRKIDAMRNPAGSALTKAADSIVAITGELSSPNNRARSAATSTRQSSDRSHKPLVQQDPLTPVPVELVNHQPGLVDSIGLVGLSIAHFAELAVIVLIFTLFMLMQRDDLRNKLFRLFGEGHLNVLTTALDDAAGRVSKYLLTQLLVNGMFGLSLGIGLYFIGVPYAPFWGALGAILRFIPYVGSSIAGICPLILSLAVFEGWTKPLLTLALFAIIELVISSAVEPWLYGAQTGLSSLAILVSTAFWTLLWGPIGLILSTPLTVCLLVMGRHVPSLSSLNILLGDDVVLPPEACYYQRLLAGDEDEAQEVAETYLKDHSLIELYDLVIIPALSMSEEDRHDHSLEEERAEFVYQSTRTLIESLEGQFPETGLPPAPETNSVTLNIVCLPARDKADELVAIMLSHVLRTSGYPAHFVSLAASEQMIEASIRHSPDVVFVSALPPLALSHARSTCRRLRRSMGSAKIIVGLWSSLADRLKADDRLSQGVCDLIVTTLADAQKQLVTTADDCQHVVVS